MSSPYSCGGFRPPQCRLHYPSSTFEGPIVLEVFACNVSLPNRWRQEMALLLFLGATWLPRLADCGGTPSPSPTPYQSLPPAPNYSAGVFLSPNTATTQIYTEGSSINVTWETSYKAVNLYFGFNPGYGDPITITSASIVVIHF